MLLSHLSSALQQLCPDILARRTDELRPPSQKLVVFYGCFLCSVERLGACAEYDSIYMHRVDPVKLDILFPACPSQFVFACWLAFSSNGMAFLLLSLSHGSNLYKVQDIKTKAITDLELCNENLWMPHDNLGYWTVYCIMILFKSIQRAVEK